MAVELVCLFLVSLDVYFIIVLLINHIWVNALVFWDSLCYYKAFNQGRCFLHNTTGRLLAILELKMHERSSHKAILDKHYQLNKSFINIYQHCTAVQLYINLSIYPAEVEMCCCCIMTITNRTWGEWYGQTDTHLLQIIIGVINYHHPDSITLFSTWHITTLLLVCNHCWMIIGNRWFPSTTSVWIAQLHV